MALVGLEMAYSLYTLALLAAVVEGMASQDVFTLKGWPRLPLRKELRIRTENGQCV